MKTVNSKSGRIIGIQQACEAHEAIAPIMVRFLAA